MDVFRRNIQKTFVEKLISMLNAPAPPPTVYVKSVWAVVPTPNVDLKKSDISSYVRGYLKQIKSESRMAAQLITDKATKFHLLDIADRIDNALNPK